MWIRARCCAPNWTVWRGRQGERGATEGENCCPAFGSLALNGGAEANRPIGQPGSPYLYTVWACRCQGGSCDSVTEEVPVTQNNSWVGVAVFPDRMSAEATLRLLTDEALPAYVSSDDHVPGLGSSFFVLVPRDLLHRAQWLLQQLPISEKELTYLATGELPGSTEDES
jgi:hypothetical protein